VSGTTSCALQGIWPSHANILEIGLLVGTLVTESIQVKLIVYLTAIYIGVA